MNQPVKLSLFLFTLALAAACANHKAFYGEGSEGWESKKPGTDQELAYRLFLIGDAGATESKNDNPVFPLLERQLQAAGDNSGVVFLGDNIYPNGLPDSEDTTAYAKATKRIDAQLSLVENYSGRIMFIPGNHDWNNSGKKGYKSVKRQQKYIEKKLDQEVFFPGGACPGPVEIELTPDVVVLLMDSEWWLTDKHHREDDCEIDSEVEVILELEDAFKRNKDRQVIIAAHHPIYSQGTHAGHASFMDHLFPLTVLHPKLYIPAPLVGSLPHAYRKLYGHRQDISHPLYQRFIDNFETSFEKYPGNMIYVSGHEHSLQYIARNDNHFIISGSGSKASPVKKSNKAGFGHGARGFGEILCYKDGSMWLQFREPDAQSPDGKIVYRQKLRDKSPAKVAKAEPKAPEGGYADSTMTVIPSELYYAGGLKRFFMGDHYRDLWATPIEVPVLDLYNEKGGLTPIKRGGGQQTKSLRFQAGDGKQYVIRSIEKYPAKALPKVLRKTVAATVVQDQISMAHPYGATLIPTLADAAEIYHTNPKVVYVPTDEKLGEYKEDFGGMLALFEERPAGDQSDADHFGNSPKLVSSPKMIDKLHEDNDNRVDQEWLLKSRLFDIFVNDWDRHEDQWRWASFKTEKGKLYRPIPRDRDQVFVKFDGFLPSWANRKWGLRKFQSFGHDTRDIAGLCFNARYVDRNFITELSLDDWLRIAKEMQTKISDQDIETAIKGMPDKPFTMEGDTIIAKLKSRRNRLPEFAERYYYILAKEIEVLGSDKREYFQVKRLDNENTEVSIYKLSKKGKRKDRFYHRVIKTSETREIRLFGLDGDDVFDISGEVQRGIIVRVIGGKGKDKITDNSKVKGWRKLTKVYDKKKKTKLDGGKETHDLRREKDPEINAYERRSFVYDFLGPVPSFGFNPDDGVFIGGGVVIRKYGFRKKPYRYYQKLAGNFSPLSDPVAFNFNYTGDFVDVFGRWDVWVRADVKAPNFASNYFGLGNETTRLVKDDSENNNFYRIRIQQIDVYPALKRGSRKGVHQVTIGPTFQFFKLDTNIAGRFITLPELNGLSTKDFQEKYYAGVKLEYTMEDIDNHQLPNRGFSLNTVASWNQDIEESGNNFTHLFGEFAFYFTDRHLPFKPTFAFRVGGATNIGEFEFFQANSLGGSPNLGVAQQIRGLPRNRFSGQSSFYQNSEIRLNLGEIKTAVIPFKIGLLGYYDIGRVWVENDTSDKLHYGTGGGLWLSPLDAVVITGTYSTSDVLRDERDQNLSDRQGLFVLQFGFLF